MKQIDCFEVRQDDGTSSSHVGFFATKEIAELAAIRCDTRSKVLPKTLKIFDTWAEYTGLAHVDLVRAALDKLTQAEITLLGIHRLARDVRR